jgi:hypothetical protein
MYEFSIDKEPLSTDELKSEIAYSDEKIAKLSRLMPLYIVTVLIIFISVIVTMLLTVVLFLESSKIDVFANHFWFSPAPYFLIAVFSVYNYLKYFCVNGVDHADKLDRERAYRESLKDASQDDCIAIVIMLKSPEISNYRDKVVAQARVFIRAEVEMMRQFHSSLGAREACKKVYMENLTSRPDAESKVISM